MYTNLRQVFVVMALLLMAVAPARADEFVSMPEASGVSENLKIRFVKYDGGTNGAMVVEVKNTGRKSSKFSSDGFFFVPKGNPEHAPQRLGAAGPFTEVAGKSQVIHQREMSLAAGETKRVRLEVFCIDSHRSSPDSSTKFSVAKNKLPKSLRKELKSSNAAIYRANKGDLKKAKSAVQSNMWQKRDKKWIKLEGERAREKQPRRLRKVRNQNMNQMPRQRQRIEPQAQH